METPSPSSRAPRHRGRWILAALVLAGLAVMFSLVQRRSGVARQLEDFEKRGYPTTLARLEHWFPDLPDAENLARVIQPAVDALHTPRGKMVPHVGSGDVTQVRGVPWPEDVLRDTRQYVADNAAAFDRIPELIARRHARFDIGYTNGSNLKLGHMVTVKRLAQGLAVKAGLDAEEGRGHEATGDILALLSTGRAFDREPFLISKLVQMACEAIGVGAADRVLNRMELAEPDLAALQAAFAERRSSNRIEQAYVGELCLALDAFGKSPAELAAMATAVATMGAGTTGAPKVQVALWTLYRLSGLQTADQAEFLRMLADLLDICRRPPWERPAELARWESEANTSSTQWYKGRILCGMLLGSLAKGAERDLAGLAALECATTALAVERHRRSHDGKLPDSLEALVPQFLPAVPKDPFDGQPLRFVRRDKGYVVYSIGTNRKDDGGRERKPGTTGKDDDVTFVMAR